jgi:hypothetical protein
MARQKIDPGDENDGQLLTRDSPAGPKQQIGKTRETG